MALEFLAWLDVPPDRRWVDVGCGTGALTETILATQSPLSIDGVDPSDGFIAFARERVHDGRAAFTVGDAQQLPFDAASRDVIVSGLVLNFVPEPAHALAEFARVLRSGGVAAAYVWDYAGQMQMLRYFWDAAASLDPEVGELDEGQRFAICRPEPLADLWQSSRLHNVEVRAIDVTTPFVNFDDYWRPFLGGQGPAPSYAMSLSEDRRTELRERIRGELPIAPDGTIPLTARAWAVKGRCS